MKPSSISALNPDSSPASSNVANHPASYRVMTLPELVEQIVQFFPNAGYTAIARGISRLWYTACSRSLRVAFDVNRIFAPFFFDVPGFRRLQCQVDMIVSGSMALSMFRLRDEKGRLTTTNSDMDLFVESSKYTAVRVFLLRDGYVQTGEFRNYHLPGHSMLSPSIPDDSYESVIRFVKGDFFIDVVCTSGTPLHCIFNFHSTVVMNIVTWDKAYCLWPRAGLIEARGLIIRMNSQRTQRAIAKYEARGFQMIRWRDEPFESIEDTRDSLAPGTRWIGDSKCWVVDLDTAGVLDQVNPFSGKLVRLLPPSDYQYEVNGFLLEYFVVPGPSQTSTGRLWAVLPRFGCCMLRHRALGHSYAVPRYFHVTVFRYINRLIFQNGAFWKYRSALYMVDSVLRDLKRTHIGSGEDSRATPLVLYR